MIAQNLVLVAALEIGAGAVLKTLAPKLWSSVRDRGVRATLALIAFRIRGILNLLAPRTIWSDRIGLRPANFPLTDVEVGRVYEWSCDDEILRWTAGSHNLLSLEAFKLQLLHDRWHLETNTRKFYIVTPTGELVGKISLTAINWTQADAELGVVLDKKYRGQRYAHDAIRALQHYMFTVTPLNRIYLGTYQDNVKAQRTATACGFHIVGTKRKFNPILGKDLDGYVMEFTRQDYRQGVSSPKR